MGVMCSSGWALIDFPFSAAATSFYRRNGGGGRGSERAREEATSSMPLHLAEWGAVAAQWKIQLEEQSQVDKLLLLLLLCSPLLVALPGTGAERLADLALEQKRARQKLPPFDWRLQLLLRHNKPIPLSRGMSIFSASIVRRGGGRELGKMDT